jgi:hypothetical protein
MPINREVPKVIEQQHGVSPRGDIGGDHRAVLHHGRIMQAA